ncbi:hypothetical protein MASR2M78_15720 [Treponema sp.]
MGSKNLYLDWIGSSRDRNDRTTVQRIICTILARDEARDIVDLLFIARNRCFHWNDALSDAQQKENFNRERFQSDLERIASDIQSLSDNSLAVADSLEL